LSVSNTKPSVVAFNGEPVPTLILTGLAAVPLPSKPLPAVTGTKSPMLTREMVWPSSVSAAPTVNTNSLVVAS